MTIESLSYSPTHSDLTLFKKQVIDEQVAPGCQQSVDT